MSRPMTKLPLVVAALALAVTACGSSNATPTAGAATPAPGVATPAPGAATPAPGGATPAPVAATSGQFCTGMKITFFPGGTTGGSFETVVYNGAKAAQAAFGPDVAYQWS
ncbi:MAG: hypothetical protein ACXWN4_06715, partial [Candidatus Limnocylindrales bacterium]